MGRGLNGKSKNASRWHHWEASEPPAWEQEGEGGGGGLEGRGSRVGRVLPSRAHPCGNPSAAVSTRRAVTKLLNLFCAPWLSYLWNENGGGASLVAQRWRIPLPVQETRVRSLGQEDPTCPGATRPVHCAAVRSLEPQHRSHNCWSPCSESLRSCRE